MTRRAFTLLETVLAAVIGSLVVLAGYAVLASLTSADRSLSRRADEQAQMAQLQRTMQRAFSSLLLAPIPANAQQPAGGAAAAGGVTAGGASENAEEPTVPPRFILGPETDERISRLTQRAKFAAGGSGGKVATPQRLEITLHKPPIVPPPSQRIPGLTLVEASEAAHKDAAGGVRGAFVLTPDEVSALSRTEDGRTGWTLWWQPMVGGDDTASVPVATGLVYCQWQVFKGREMHAELSAGIPADLPAYVQLEVETLGGLYANYMFELAWTVGEEPGTVIEEPAPTPTLGGAGGQGGILGGPGGPGFTGTQGGPGGPGQRPGRRPDAMPAPGNTNPGQAPPTRPAQPTQPRDLP
ncbi:MAG: hypothetical protein KIS87_07605 [Phycisphaeraceae bacterium]|nr:hypothetical protein [Phycisphaeraceae bacterium]